MKKELKLKIKLILNIKYNFYEKYNSFFILHKKFKILVKQRLKSSYAFILYKNLIYVWFPENLRENARERKYKGKVEGKEKVKENKKID